MTLITDLNCDLGEGTDNDALIMPYITSANIACGFHAGDEVTMRETLRLAKQHGVRAGAHPGWHDKANFGRNDLHLPELQVFEIITEQVQTLSRLARAEGIKLRHVKPHGALYNQAATDPALAATIARAVKSISTELILVGLAGSALPAAGLEHGLHVFHEAFPDRAYLPGGHLMPRSQPNAVLEEPQQVVENALRLANEGIRFGGQVIFPDTLCLHSDNPAAVENARLVHQRLQTK